MNHNYTFLISVGTLLLAEKLTQSEQQEERKKKKENVLEKKRELLRSTFPELTASVSLQSGLDKLLRGEWPKDEALTFLIDLAFTNPFAPYELKFSDKDFEVALKEIASLVDLSPTDVDRIRDTQKEAFKAHRHLEWKTIAFWGIGGLAVIGTGGWLAAPYIGAAV